MVNILDSKLFSKKDVFNILSDAINCQHPRAITFVNPFSYYILNDRPELVKNIDYIFIDGLLLEKLHNFFNTNKVERASFDLSSIAADVFSFLADNQLKLSFIGSTRNEIPVAVENIQNMFPSLNVCTYRDGYFSGPELKNYLSQLRQYNPDVLLVGTGTPLQEEIVCLAKEMTIGKLLFTCGGFLTQTSLKPDYYHPMIKKLDLRWLQRAILHQHVRKRLLYNYPKFLVRYVFENIIATKCN